MAAVGWTGFMLFLLLNISMGKDTESFTVSCDVGRTVTLPCKLTMSNCSMVTWLFSSNSNPNTSIELVAHGNVTGKDTQKAGRLTVGSDCSLHINDLNTEDTGRYICRLYHNNNNFTDISAVSLSLCKNTKTKSTTPVVSPSTVSPTDTKTKSTTPVVSPSTVSLTDTKTKSTTPVVSPTTVSPTDIKTHFTTLTAATNVSSANNSDNGGFPVVAVAASCVAVCVGVCVTIVIILIYKRTPDNQLSSSQVKVSDTDSVTYAVVDLKKSKQKESNRKTDNISCEYAAIRTTQ